MIATNIGKTFLNAYNEKFERAYSAKEFFVEIYFTLFFDHEKYMQWVTNSPFVQGIKKGVPPTSDERKLKLQTLLDKIATNEADASIAIGFPSLDLTASTSGQITSMNLPLKEEDVYLSWIGSGFGIGVQSGLSMFFDNRQILLDLFEGWKIYRDFLNTTPELRGNQINTWNGQWLAHRYNKSAYDVQHPTASFNPFDPIKGGGMEVRTQLWTKVLVGIARNFPNTLETAYVYNLGQTNTTIGFIPFELPKIRFPYELYEKYFGTTDKYIVENLFGTAVGFTKVCQMGTVGTNALEPKGFKDCFTKGEIPTYSNSDEEKKINFNTYQIWLLAMLSNEQLWEQAQQIALTLSNYSKSDKNARTKKSQEVATLLSSVNKKQFIDGLTILVGQGQDVDQLNQIAEMLHLMPVDNVPYFLTLIRFQYSVISKKSLK
ncbi:MAG: hypothetical protein LBS55_05270 [Prevotellaceae bacterium]|jgi:hypothetical protein|nr:hypothetical protein [Prevotellaceae bacterium]